MSKLHHLPEDGYFGDPIPFFALGSYHVFYDRVKKDGRISWGHIASRDLLHWTEHPVAIDNGSFGAWDELQCITGSVVEDKDGFHAFYTGVGRSGPAILHAASTDLVQWIKDPDPILTRDSALYRDDITWRDPHVFRNEAEGNWWMVFCARRPFAGRGMDEDPFPGVLGLAKSHDLRHWELKPPFWDPGIAKAIECPDLFQTGPDSWMLIYFRHTTEIRLSESLSGPWRPLPHGPLNSFDFFSGKTLVKDGRRLLIGWIPRKSHDCAHRIWGGTMAVPRELYTLLDGSPAVRCAPELIEGIRNEAPAIHGGEVFTPISGSWAVTSDRVITRSSGRGSVCLWREAPRNYLMKGTMLIGNGAGTISLIIRCHADPQAAGSLSCSIDTGYELKVDAGAGLVTLTPFYEWMQRPPIAAVSIGSAQDQHLLFELILDGDILECFLDGKKALVSRLLEHGEGGIALFVQDMDAGIGDIGIFEINGAN